MEFTLVPIPPVHLFYSQKLNVTWETKSSRCNFSKENNNNICRGKIITYGSWQNNLGSSCFLIIQCISENFYSGLACSVLVPVLGSKGGRSERLMPFTSGGAQALSLISSLSVKVRSKRKGRGACPVESLQRKRGKMSSGDSERILAVSGHSQAILCLLDHEQEQGLPFLF